MRNNIPNLNDFPTDNSPSTQLKYDIIASKFMTGIHNHNRRNAPSNPMVSFGLVGAVLEGVVAVVVIGLWGCGGCGNGYKLKYISIALI